MGSVTSRVIVWGDEWTTLALVISTMPEAFTRHASQSYNHTVLHSDLSLLRQDTILAPFAAEALVDVLAAEARKCRSYLAMRLSHPCVMTSSFYIWATISATTRTSRCCARRYSCIGIASAVLSRLISVPGLGCRLWPTSRGGFPLLPLIPRLHSRLYCSIVTRMSPVITYIPTRRLCITAHLVPDYS